MTLILFYQAELFFSHLVPFLLDFSEGVSGVFEGKKVLLESKICFLISARWICVVFQVKSTLRFLRCLNPVFTQSCVMGMRSTELSSM